MTSVQTQSMGTAGLMGYGHWKELVGILELPEPVRHEIAHVVSDPFKCLVFQYSRVTVAPAHVLLLALYTRSVDQEMVMELQVQGSTRHPSSAGSTAQPLSSIGEYWS